MPDIDDRFIDVDFVVQPEYVFGDLGLPLFADFGPSYEELYGVMSDAEIRAAIEQTRAAGGGLELLVTHILNQRNEGSCVGNAFTQANHVVQAKQFGKDKVIKLSAISLYKRIGRSPGSGATVSSGIEEMQSRGILPLDTPENRALFGHHVMPPTGFYTPFPSGWETTGRMFAGLESHIVKSVGGLMTALCQGHPVVVGRQGHSIVYLGLIIQGGRIYAIYANSWGNWGQGYGELSAGFGHDSPNQIQQSANWAVAVRAVTVPTLPVAA